MMNMDEIRARMNRQFDEMECRLGPAKGRDPAPWRVARELNEQSHEG